VAVACSRPLVTVVKTLVNQEKVASVMVGGHGRGRKCLLVSCEGKTQNLDPRFYLH